MVIIATGILLLVGTVTTFIKMVPKIDEPYRIQGIDLTSYVFILGGAGVIGLGIYLSLRSSKGRRRPIVTSRTHGLHLG